MAGGAALPGRVQGGCTRPVAHRRHEETRPHVALRLAGRGGAVSTAARALRTHCHPRAAVRAHCHPHPCLYPAQCCSPTLTCLPPAFMRSSLFFARRRAIATASRCPPLSTLTNPIPLFLSHALRRTIAAIWRCGVARTPPFTPRSRPRGKLTRAAPFRATGLTTTRRWL
eukprot:159162-Prymnesium_polylepis.1